MIDSTINNPEFKRFIRRYQNPILIIDDCEMMFSETYNRSNILVNNLLQLIDGFLSDSIQANVITIFNVDDVDEIDHSLLDCNNLILNNDGTIKRRLGMDLEQSYGVFSTNIQGESYFYSSTFEWKNPGGFNDITYLAIS